MSTKRMGKRTVRLSCPPSVAAGACIVGKKEGKGPLRDWFDEISEDSYFGEKSWEKAESTMLRRCFSLACDKAGIPPSDIEYIFTGDLQNQCTGSSFALRDTRIPLFGLYGACSTMAESLSLAAMAIDGGYADVTAALTSSHYSSAERQFRVPMEYGGQRPPTAHWTVTGAGALILRAQGPGPYITHVTTGSLVDPGIKDSNNMGAAMAPAAYETLKAHFEDTGRSPSDYAAIVTGDLGRIGHGILRDLFQSDGVDLGPTCMDCGLLIFATTAQDVHAGGSGCGCSASVLAGHLLHQMTEGVWPRLLFAATGALMSSTSAMQKESIPGICHAVALDMDRGC